VGKNFHGAKGADRATVLLRHHRVSVWGSNYGLLKSRSYGKPRSSPFPTFSSRSKNTSLARNTDQYLNSGLGDDRQEQWSLCFQSPGPNSFPCTPPAYQADNLIFLALQEHHQAPRHQAQLPQARGGYARRYVLLSPSLSFPIPPVPPPGAPHPTYLPALLPICLPTLPTIP